MESPPNIAMGIDMSATFGPAALPGGYPRVAGVCNAGVRLPGAVRLQRDRRVCDCIWRIRSNHNG